jgi:hypothetical protein
MGGEAAEKLPTFFRGSAREGDVVCRGAGWLSAETSGAKKGSALAGFAGYPDYNTAIMVVVNGC